MQTLPRWDISPIYPGIKSDEFLSDLAHMGELASRLDLMLDDESSRKADLTEWLARVLATYQDMLDHLETLNAYASAVLTTDTADVDAMNGLNKVEEAALQVQAVDVKLLNAFAAEQDGIERLLVSKDEFKPYAYVVGELFKAQKHQMSPAEEALAADLNRSGTDAWSRLQEAVSSSATAVWDESTGERKTVIQLRALATDADRAVREKAYRKELEVWKEHEVDMAYSLCGVKGATITLDRRRGWHDPLDRAVSQARIDRTVLDALIHTLEKNLPMFRKYLMSKAKLLGVGRCAFYDLFAPVGTSTKKWSFNEAREFIIRQFSAFSPAMGAFAKSAFERNWIDAEPRHGKVGGAYDTAFPLRRQSRILSNFDYSFSGVSTLAHELGHAYHDSIVLGYPSLLRTYPMTLAETASIFSEFIVFQGALADSDVEGGVALIEHFLQDACQVCVDILCRFYFENAVFARRQEGDLMADELCAMMLDCQKKTYGEGLDPEALHPYMWAVKGHYYSSDLSFYNFPYAFGQLFGLGLYARSKEDASFPESYVKLLRKTGSDSAVNVAATAGCDITGEAFWQEGMDIISSYCEQFCAFADGQGR